MDDEEQYYVAKKNEMLRNRYQIYKQLGKGTFGTVYSCIDKQSGKACAIKILRALEKYHAAGQQELNTLVLVKQSLNPFKQQLAEVVDYFDFNNHFCIVFPLYGVNLLELLKANGYRGYNIDWTRELSKSFLQGISVMHINLRKIHTDIKPENIMTRSKPVSTQVRDRMFVHPPGADLITIDLGSSVGVADERKPVIVCTRQYRPPEIMLGLEYDLKLDIWSCACVIYETLTGRTLFRTHHSVVHMCLIQKIIGPMPVSLIEKMYRSNRCVIIEFFDPETGLWGMPPDAEDPEVQSLRMSKTIEEELDGQKYILIHLLKWMLAWDPAERPTIQQVLEHPFFNEPSKEFKSVQTINNKEWADIIQSFVDGRIQEQDFVNWWRQETGERK